MRDMKFWDDEYELIKTYDKKILEKRGKELWQKFLLKIS
jgi:hypothetical protein